MDYFFFFYTFILLCATGEVKPVAAVIRFRVTYKDRRAFTPMGGFVLTFSLVSYLDDIEKWSFQSDLCFTPTMSVSKKWFHNAEKESLQFGPLGINFFMKLSLEMLRQYLRQQHSIKGARQRWRSMWPGTAFSARHSWLTFYRTSKIWLLIVSFNHWKKICGRVFTV